MKNKIITLLSTLILSFAFTISCHAEGIGILDTYENYLNKLQSVVIVDQNFLHPDTKVLITKDFQSIHGQQVKTTKLYFIKDVIVKADFELENPKAEKETLAEMKKDYTEKNSYTYKKQKVDEPGFIESINEFENPFQTVTLIYHNSQSFGEKLTVEIIMDTKREVPLVEGTAV